MTTTTINNINAPLAREVSAEIAALTELFASSAEKERIRRLKIREESLRPKKVAPVMQDIQKVMRFLKFQTKDFLAKF